MIYTSDGSIWPLPGRALVRTFALPLFNQVANDNCSKVSKLFIHDGWFVKPLPWLLPLPNHAPVRIDFEG